MARIPHQDRCGTSGVVCPEACRGVSRDHGIDRQREERACEEWTHPMKVGAGEFVKHGNPFLHSSQTLSRLRCFQCSRAPGKVAWSPLSVSPRIFVTEA